MDGVIPNVLDYWADPVDHPLVELHGWFDCNEIRISIRLVRSHQISIKVAQK